MSLGWGGGVDRLQHSASNTTRQPFKGCRIAPWAQQIKIKNQGFFLCLSVSDTLPQSKAIGNWHHISLCVFGKRERTHTSKCPPDDRRRAIQSQTPRSHTHPLLLLLAASQELIEIDPTNHNIEFLERVLILYVCEKIIKGNSSVCVCVHSIIESVA